VSDLLWLPAPGPADGACGTLPTHRVLDRGNILSPSTVPLQGPGQFTTQGLVSRWAVAGCAGGSGHSSGTRLLSKIF